MDDLLVLASELVKDGNYKKNNYEEHKPDGDYNVIIESIALKESEQTGTQWFNIVSKVLDGEYAEEKFYTSYFLTEKAMKISLANLMKFVNACGYEVDVNMFTDLDTLNEALQPLVGSVCILNKSTSKKGFVSYTFNNGEGE